ncbi:MAG: non-homologous end-joining DNA ligase [Firmicutes bacterium]|nr:non-homologous end-joining DNA ligase [Candidatus Fermentithermobacillaceae bacterium]
MRVRVGPREVTLTNLDKVLWPGDNFTKRDLIQYYARVSRYILPHLRDRPLSLVRYPDGISAPGFYQKDAPPGTPRWVKTLPLASGSSRIIRYILCNDPATLVWLANQAVVEVNPWSSRWEHLSAPDFAVFDLDPAEGSSWEDVKTVARAVKAFLDELGLRSFPKLSGATGLHVYVPVKNEYSHSQIVLFVKRAAKIIEAAMPEKVTLKRPVEERYGKVYIDYLQNSRGQTIVAAYSVRARPGAPVSMPISWDELDSVEPRCWNIKTVPERLEQKGDLFEPCLYQKQKIDRLLSQ